MKTKNLFLVPVLIAGLGLILAGRLTAQTFTVLHSFTPIPEPEPSANGDGAYPLAGLLLSGNTLYGTASAGGGAGAGTVFAVNTDGMGFTNLHSFNVDGTDPWAGLLLSGNTLYGTTIGEGSFGVVLLSQRESQNVRYLFPISVLKESGSRSFERSSVSSKRNQRAKRPKTKS